jgi:hypothetical protein
VGEGRQTDRQRGKGKSAERTLTNNYAPAGELVPFSRPFTSNRVQQPTVAHPAAVRTFLTQCVPGFAMQVLNWVTSHALFPQPPGAARAGVAATFDSADR